MKRITKYTFAALTLTFLLAATACGATDNEATAPNTAADVTYEQLSAEQAKEIMDSEQPYYLIDARTDAEFAEGHIAGAVVIPEYEIAQRAENEIADKDALILVYCRSGRRSKIAAEELIKLGYTNVKEFGGIIDWPYEIEK
ncbi:MAG: rhodanese-like domain-containing protein [Clostridia bacterium]|nr:rhodanese-like domain-containing protein [Clostridia bacterium]